MCGIVGLFAKHPDVEERLGAHLGAMLVQMANRGPDSAGIAIYREGHMEIIKEVGDPRSGATWAPVYVSYAYNNRTQMLRVPAAGRVEDRTVDGSCNPYLAATVLLAAGLDGIERELDPGDPNTLNLYESSAAQRAGLGIDTLPENLLDATRELERDDVLRRALGKTRDGDYLDYFVECKRREVQAAHEQITQWELDRYLQLF